MYCTYILFSKLERLKNMRYGNGQYFIYQPDTNYMQIPSTCIANVIVYYRDNLLIWAVAIYL